jgi:CO/xanthine dehydrogenase FAD-binding subunit
MKQLLTVIARRDSPAMWNEYYLCEAKDQASDLLHRYGGEARVIAGGTDLILQMEASGNHLPALIDITRIQDLQEITAKDDRIFIGAAVTFQQIINSSMIFRHAPHLVAAARTVAGRQIRNVATIAGNIVNASPAADSAPVLYTLDARIHFIDEQKKQHEMPISQFISGVNTTLLPRCSLVTGVSFPIRDHGWHTSFRKLGLRQSMAISVVNASTALFEQEGIIRDAYIAFGAVAPTPVRASEAEQELIGLPLSKAASSEAPRLARLSVSPIDDFRASAAYRLQMVENILRQELRKLSNVDHKEVTHVS